MAARLSTVDNAVTLSRVCRALCARPIRSTPKDGIQPRSSAPLSQRWLAFTFLALAASPAVAQKAPVCRVALIEAELRSGQSFERHIGNGLELMLEPLASGWIVRVVPAHGPRGQHDYAELATPPYHSVSPLLISTDYSFRAQDALAWNPRHFRYASDRASFLELERWYKEYESAPNDPQVRRVAESKLAQLAAQAPEAELTILDAHLVQGTADQAGTAAMVASHLNASAHEVDQPADGNATPLGRLNSLRFQVRLNLPKAFPAAPGLAVRAGGCT